MFANKNAFTSRSAFAMAGEKATVGPGARRMSSALFGAASASLAEFVDHVFDKPGYDAAGELMYHPCLFESGIEALDFGQQLSDEGNSGDIPEIEEAGAQAIVYVVSVVSDVVGQSGALRLSPGIKFQFQRVNRVKTRDVRRQRAFCSRTHKGAVVLDQPLQSLPGQIQPVIARVAALQLGDDAERLGVVVEPAKSRHARGQHVLAGMSERGVPEVMGEGHRFGKVLVESERPRQGSGNLPDLDGVREAGAEVIAVQWHENLRLVGKTAEGRGMQHAVAIPLERAARARGGFLKHAPSRERCVTGVRRQRQADRQA